MKNFEGTRVDHEYYHYPNCSQFLFGYLFVINLYTFYHGKRIEMQSTSNNIIVHKWLLVSLLISIGGLIPINMLLLPDDQGSE